MILFHYSVDSYTDAPSLTNDYAGHYKYAEPFLLALERGRAVFDAMFFSAMYVSRDLVDLGLRKNENYRKDAVEGIFEYVRRTELGGVPVSRLRCVYYCSSMEEARRYVYDDALADGSFSPEQVKLLTVETPGERAYAYDQQLYNAAMEAVKENDIDAVFALARRYFALERTEHPLIEILADGENRVIKAETY